MIKKRVWITIIILIILLGAVTISAMADDSIPPFSSEEITEEAWIPGAPEILGDDPDEIGYTGEVSQAGEIPQTSEDTFGVPGGYEGPDLNNVLEGPDIPGWQGVWENSPDTGEGSSEETGVITERQPNWDAQLQGEPDYIDVTTRASMDAGLDISYLYYYAAGAVFRPRTNDTTWSYMNAGCLSVPKGNEWFVTPVNLPETATILGLRMFFYDAVASDGWAWVTRYNGSGLIEDIGGVVLASSGTAGYGTSYIGLTHEVDTFGWSYVLNYRANNNTSDMRLCGLRIYYSIP